MTRLIRILLAATTVVGLTAASREAAAYATLDSSCNPRWPASSLPSPYYVNQSGYSRIDLPTLRSIFTASFAAWGEPCCSGFSARELGLTTAVGEDNTQRDNIFSFRESSWPAELGDASSVLAVTLPAWDSRCRIVSADMVFNAAAHQFATAGRLGANDLQSITTHECGHWLGLDHSSISSATMYYAYTGGEGGRTLHQDDIDGVCFLYPQSCGCSSTADCTGAGEECISGECVVPPCSSDTDCDAGLICDSGDCVVPPCSSDADCVGNQTCVSGTCVASADCPICQPCSAADDCGGTPYVCAQDPAGGTGGICIRLCDSAADCPGDSQCFSVETQGFNVCLNPEAASGSVCPSDYVCTDGGSTGPCDGVSCGAGEACNPATGQCEPTGPATGCDICSPCTTNADCNGGSCLDFGGGGVCSQACTTADDCAGTNTDCFGVTDTGGNPAGSFCFNDDGATAGACPASWICEDDTVPVDPCDGVICGADEVCDPGTGVCVPNGDPFDGSRGGDCIVCDGCRTDADCGGGSCVSFVGVGAFCVLDCASSGCPGNTDCFTVGSGATQRSVCLNSDAASGICPADFVCDTSPTTEPDASPSDDTETGGNDTGVEADTGTGGNDTGSTGTGDNGGSGSRSRGTTTTSGCSAAGGGLGPAQLAAALIALAAVARRRRVRAA